MDIDVDTFVTTVYCIVDDMYKAHWAPLKPVRPGTQPEMSDSEVLSVMLLAQWQANRSERAFVAYVQRHWRHYFPRMLSQSAFNRRARDLCGVLMQLGPTISQDLSAHLLPTAAYQVLDGVPVPLMARCRGQQHRLFAHEAAIGRGGSDKTWFYGLKLVAAVTPSGQVTGFVLSPANTEERWSAEALLRWRVAPSAPAVHAEDLAEVLGPAHRRHGQRLGPTGPISSWLSVGSPSDGPYLADLGFRGTAWTRHWRQDYGAVVLTKADYATLAEPTQRRAAQRWLNGLRQVIETVNGCLTERFGLKFPRARTYWGVLTRVAAKVAAHNLAIHINLCFGRPLFAAFNPLA